MVDKFHKTKPAIRVSFFRVSGKPYVRLCDDYVFDVVYRTHYQRFTAPKNFLSDGASIPRIFRPFLGTLRAVNAGIEHDYLYSSGKLPRVDSDLHFRKRLKDMGVGFVIRHCAYYAVRLFGRRYYNNDIYNH